MPVSATRVRGDPRASLTVRAQHLSFDVQRAIDGFIAHGGTPTGTLDFYNMLSNPTHVGKSVIYITQTLVGDAFVVRAFRLLQ